MAGRRLPRWLFSWLCRWFPWCARSRRGYRPPVHYSVPTLVQLEERWSPTSLNAATPVELAPAAVAPRDREVPASSSETHKTSNLAGFLPSEPIRLIPSPPPPKADDRFVSTNTTPPEEPSPAQQFGSKQDTAALDDLFSQPLPWRPSPPPSPAPNPQAQGGGGAPASGISAPNAVGGGGANGGGGAGPAVTNANQFFSPYLNMVGSALAPAAATTATTPAVHIAPANAPTLTPSAAPAQNVMALPTQAAAKDTPSHLLTSSTGPSGRHGSDVAVQSVRAVKQPEVSQLACFLWISPPLAEK